MKITNILLGVIIVVLVLITMIVADINQMMFVDGGDVQIVASMPSQEIV